MPTRFDLNKIGPGLSNLIAIAVIMKIGERITMASAEKTMSNIRFHMGIWNRKIVCLGASLSNKMFSRSEMNSYLLVQFCNGSSIDNGVVDATFHVYITFFI